MPGVRTISLEGLTSGTVYSTFVWHTLFRSIGGCLLSHGHPRTAKSRLVFDQAAFSMRSGSGLGAAFRRSDLPCGKLELPAASSPEADFSGKIPSVNSSAFVNSFSGNFSGEFFEAQKSRGFHPGIQSHRDDMILRHHVITGRQFAAFARRTQQNLCYFVAFARSH